MNQTETDKIFQGQRIESSDDFYYWLRYIGANNGYWPLVDFRKVGISKYMSKRARQSAYVEFDIPKKTGGVRHIVAPNVELKAVQSCINVLLQALYEPHECATGFIRGQNVRSNAERHIGSSCMLNLDLKDFFPSITKDMVRRALKEELSEQIPSAEVRNMICSLCTIPTPDGSEVLPQGAPTSPVLSNIVLKRLDRRLAALAGAHGYNYTRYADDITFSHNRAGRRFSRFFMDKTRAMIEDYGLQINDNKTRISATGGRMEVTGLTVGDKVNVSRRYIKQLRTLLHLWEHYGLAEAQKIYDRDFSNGVHTDLKSVIGGKINYLTMIRGKEDRTAANYAKQFSNLLHNNL